MYGYLGTFSSIAWKLKNIYQMETFDRLILDALRQFYGALQMN